MSIHGKNFILKVVVRYRSTRFDNQLRVTKPGSVSLSQWPVSNGTSAYIKQFCSKLKEIIHIIHSLISVSEYQQMSKTNYITHLAPAWDRNCQNTKCWLTTATHKTDTAFRSVMKMTKLYTSWAIKTCHFVFDYNSGVSWSIFVLLVPVETERNTLQSSYKIYHFTLNVSLHYLVKLKTTKRQHILKSIVTVHSFKPVVYNFHRMSESLQCSSFPILGRKFCYQMSHSHRFTINFLGLSSNST